MPRRIEKLTNINSANSPRSSGGATYHLHTEEDFFSRSQTSKILYLPGAQNRVKLLGSHLYHPRYRKNEDRGLLSVTGTYKGLGVTAVAPLGISGANTGMGSASAGIIMHEAYQSGARIFIRGGSQGCMIEDSKPGQAMIVNKAWRWDGVSSFWLPEPLRRQALLSLASYRWWDASLLSKAHPALVKVLSEAASRVAPNDCYVSSEGTTADFYNEQCRPGLTEEIPEYLQERHRQALGGDLGGYSMEAAAVFTWAKYKTPSPIPAVAINAIYAQRRTDEFADEPTRGKGDELVVQIVLESLAGIASTPEFAEVLAS